MRRLSIMFRTGVAGFAAKGSLGQNLQGFAAKGKFRAEFTGVCGNGGV